MNRESKYNLIAELAQLAEEEQAYLEWYKEEEKRVAELAQASEPTRYDPQYYFYKRHRAPNKALIKESLKMIGRLSFILAKEEIGQ